MNIINLPGDISEQDQIHEMIRVNHAGEYGASQIYKGQLAALATHPVATTLQHMYDQELHHLNTFKALMVQRRVRPTVLSPLWHVAGFALGYVTGKLGVKAAMACTVAVEEVIDDHYHEQEMLLDNMPHEQELKANIVQFRQEELEHRDIGLEQHATTLPYYKLLKLGITWGIANSNLAIKKNLTNTLIYVK